MKNIKNFLRPATIVSALPNTISNGQTADATPLMADLNHLVNQVNANAAPLSNTALLDTANTFTAVQSGLAATAAANFPIATQVQNSVFLTLTSTLGTNTITARCAALTLTALTNGQIFTFVPNQTNTGPLDLNPDGLGNTRVLMMGTNVSAGNIIKDVPLAVRYQSPYFHAINSPGPLATLVAAQASTSGTAINFTGIPSGVKRITVMFNGVSTNGTSNIVITIGDAGGIETSGYVSNSQSNNAQAASTVSFIVTEGIGAGSVQYGAIVLNLEKSSGFSWMSSGILLRDTIIQTSAGFKSLSAELTQLQITTVNGTDAFDLGEISISYE